MNNKVQNKKVEVETTEKMNNRDLLNDILETEKNMSVNFTIALNEASNEELNNKLFNMFNDIKTSQRSLFELAFKKGWYCLEKAEENKITEEFDNLSTLFNELNKSSQN